MALVGCRGGGDLDERFTPELLGAALAGEPVDVVVVFDRGALVPRARTLVPAWVEPKAQLMEESERWRDYPELPLAALYGATVDDLAALGARPEVVRVEEARTLHTSLVTSLPLIGQPAAATAGARGSGVGIAVIDTGVNYAHAAFGACAVAGAPGCAVVAAVDLAPDDGAADDNGHGTNVAAIALGVAPDARVVGLDVFSGAGASSLDVIGAVNWVVQHRAQYGLQVMNLSLGGGAFTAPCANDAMAVALETARTAGVLAAVASGNEAYTDRISAPACAPAAVSVGAVYTANHGGLQWSGCTDVTTGADRVTCFSNSASFVTLLAPGALITAGGHTMGGTSQASPHVAGALAVLRAAFPSESLTQSVARLTGSGTRITDPRNGVALPRLALSAALAAASPTPSPSPSPTPSPSPSAPPAVDTTPPAGARLSINGGARFTNSRNVTLTIGATNPADAAQMCVSNTTSCTAWRAFATSLSWSTASASGAQTVRLWLRDAARNASSPVSASITMDTTAPRNPTLRGTAAATSVALTFGAATDATAGFARYVLVGARSTSAPACTAAPLYSGTARSFTHSGLTRGSAYSYRLCAVDNAGNRSSGTALRVTTLR